MPADVGLLDTPAEDEGKMCVLVTHGGSTAPPAGRDKQTNCTHFYCPGPGGNGIVGRVMDGRGFWWCPAEEEWRTILGCFEVRKSRREDARPRMASIAPATAATLCTVAVIKWKCAELAVVSSGKWATDGRAPRECKGNE